MAISSVGIGSGLDVESIVTQMIALEKQPIKTLEAKAEVISSKISTYGEIKSLVDDLNSAVRDLTLDSGFGSVKINSSNSTAVSATMTGLAAQGSYNIAVQQLAQSQTSATLKLDGTKALGVNGTISFSFGNPGNTSATPTTFSISLASTDKLVDVAAKINGDSALSKSVVASVITDSSGQQQLMIRSRETGLDNQFTVSLAARDLDAAGQAQFDADVAAWNQWTAWSAWNGLSAADKAATAEPAKDLLGSSPVAPEVSSLVKLSGATGLQTTQSAQNAKMSLNGVAIESNTNAFKEVVPGLTINVTEAGKTSLLNVTQDKDATQEKIQKFVDAYNAVNDLLSSSTKYDSESDVAGILQGDSSTVSLQNSLRMLTQGIVGNVTGAFSRLSDIGIQMAQGGKLSINATKMATALEDMDSVKSLFSAKSDALGNGGGIAVNFKTLTDGLLAWEGALNTKTDSLEEQLKRNKSEVERVETRAETVEARLRKQYSALDVKMASLSSLSSYVEQMVASWNKSKD